MNHINPYLLCGELDEGVRQSLNGTVNVTLHYHIEFLEVSDGDPAPYLFQSHVLLSLDALDPKQLLAFVRDGFSFLLVIHHVELVACARRSVKSQYRDWS